MIERQPYLPRWMAGGPGNPLGARALYLGATVYRIHGTNQPQTIGHAVSSGCFRLVNNDVIDLYNRVPVGTRVVAGAKRPNSSLAGFSPLEIRLMGKATNAKASLLRVIALTPLLATIAAALPCAAAAQTLNEVKSRGALICGVSEGLLGFSAPDPKSNWAGVRCGLLAGPWRRRSLVTPVKSVSLP